MKFRFLSSGLTAAVMVVSSMAPLRVVAQSRSTPAMVEVAIKAAAAKPTPRAADGHPDLNGYWNFPEFDVSAHRDSQGNFYIDVSVLRKNVPVPRNASCNANTKPTEIPYC